MMRHISSDRLGDLAEIYSDDVELVSIMRPGSTDLSQLAANLSSSRTIVASQWEQVIDDDDAPRRELSSVIDSRSLKALSAEIALATDVLHTLMDCDGVGVRVATLRTPMCPRFHVDQVPCRMLVTISGQGTEWIASDEVDRTKFANRTDDNPPIRNGASIRQLKTGSWSLLKGGTWDGTFPGVVHRSPHEAQHRLFLSLDPLFSSTKRH